MIHAVSVSSTEISADVGAVRLFEVPPHIPSVYVDAKRLALSSAVEQALRDWPMSEDSVFERSRRQHLSDHTFRPQERLDGSPRTHAHLFRLLESTAKVVDAYCVSFPVAGPVWGMLVYLRCGTSPRFDDAQVHLLQRIKTAISRVVRNGYLRETHGLKPLTESAGTLSSAKNLSAGAVLAKLSRTEQLILNYLRSDTTERQIAQTIHRSPHTIHAHVKNIYRKLGINSRRSLLVMLDRSHG